MMTNAIRIFCIVALLGTTSCYRVPRKLEPELTYAAQDSYIRSLPPPFPPLTLSERKTAWGQEYMIGLAFAEDLDLYRAISTLKRAEILIPKTNTPRLEEIQYLIVLSYYLGKRYEDAIYVFEHSDLKEVTHHFSAYHDLLLILYESYRENNEPQKAEYIYELIKERYPKTAEKLELSTALIDGNIDDLRCLKKKHPDNVDIELVINNYDRHKKSISKAEWMNAVLPGAGYLYVGQKQSALTAFLINGLFIAAAVHFFHKGNTAAGIITTSFEAGWYFGGIYGAGEAAKLYNERIYEKKAYETLSKEKLFPVLMLQYGF